MATFRNDNVRVPFRRLDKLHVHRPHRRHVLLDHRFNRAPALIQVASQTANETNIVRRVDEHLNIHLLE